MSADIEIASISYTLNQPEIQFIRAHTDAVCFDGASFPVRQDVAAFIIT